MADRDIGFVQDLNSRYLACRALRHQFDLTYFGPASGIANFKSRYTIGTVIRQSTCARCGLLKEDFFNAPNANRAAMGLTFTAFHRRYRYPDSYLWDQPESEIDRPVNGDYNYELFHRFNNGGESDGA